MIQSNVRGVVRWVMVMVVAASLPPGGAAQAHNKIHRRPQPVRMAAAGGVFSVIAGDSQPTGPLVQLTGHVQQLTSFALPTFSGSEALVGLSNGRSGSIFVRTESERLEAQLRAAITSGNLVKLYAHKYNKAPAPPNGGTYAYDVYAVDGILLYSGK